MKKATLSTLKKESVNQFILVLLFASLITILYLLNPSFLIGGTVDRLADVLSPNATTISGKVIKIEGQTVFIKANNDLEQVTFDQSVKLTKNGFSSSVENIKLNDHVIMTLNPSGKVLSADAVSSFFLDWGKWVLPLGLGLLIILFLVSLIRNQTRKYYIRSNALPVLE